LYIKWLLLLIQKLQKKEKLFVKIAIN
jgi:hypothetical protein